MEGLRRDTGRGTGRGGRNLTLEAVARRRETAERLHVAQQQPAL